MSAWIDRNNWLLTYIISWIMFVCGTIIVASSPVSWISVLMWLALLLQVIGSGYFANKEQSGWQPRVVRKTIRGRVI